MVCELAYKKLKGLRAIIKVGWLLEGLGRHSLLDCAMGVVPMANSGPVPRFDLRKGELVGLGWVVAAPQSTMRQVFGSLL